MNKTRRIGAMVAATVAATGMAMTVTAAPAAAARPRNDGPSPISRLLGSVDENDTSRVAIWFQTDETVCDFKLAIRGSRNVQVWHNDGRTSSLFRDDTLRRGERDFASVRVRTGNVRRDSIEVLPATIWYRDCDRRGDDNDRNGNDRDRDRYQSKSFGVVLRIEDDNRR